MSGQQLRHSQFITTYGPGAILEGPDGPRIIPVVNQSGVFDEETSPEDFEITDDRLSRTLLEGSRIVRLPSNAELDEPDDRWVYQTERFPRWSLCTKHDKGVLYRKSRGDKYACPKCDPLEDKYEAWDRATQQAIRFLMACPDGHVDDVNWDGLLSHDCDTSYLYWIGAGGALRDINVVCPSCGSRMNLGYAYSREWNCSGCFPEINRNERGNCDKNAKIIQRNAANLRISEVRSALTIPPLYKNIHRILQSSRIKPALQVADIDSKGDLIDVLETLTEQDLNQKTVEEVKKYEEKEILGAIDDILNYNAPEDEEDLRIDEFRALQKAAEQGAPPEPASDPLKPPQFEVVEDKVRMLEGPNEIQLRVTSVDRVRVVMVQKGYRRLDPMNRVVDRSFQVEQSADDWYPGVELFGEGIFIDLAPESLDDSENHFTLTGESAHSWEQAWKNPDRYGQSDFSDEDSNLHPVFVWWHTLSHRLIKSISIDSGYSSASVRERVYVDVGEGSNALGGVLLYTVQPGGDGTLGGLVALASEFERVIDSAFRDLSSCSNDPLCRQDNFQEGQHSGAACYACCHVSETSCEHRNMRLDRNLLLNNLP